jgi:hypothetical protein
VENAEPLRQESTIISQLELTARSIRRAQFAPDLSDARGPAHMYTGPRPQAPTSNLNWRVGTNALAEDRDILQRETS